MVLNLLFVGTRVYRVLKGFNVRTRVYRVLNIFQGRCWESSVLVHSLFIDGWG